MTQPPTVGTRGPDFQSRNQFGQPVSLSELSGTPVVLVFFPFAFTGLCTGELRELRDHSRDFGDLGARVLAVSTDTMYAQRVFAEQEDLRFDLLSDHWPHGGIAQAYGVFDTEVGCAARGSFVLDAEGIVVWTAITSLGERREVAQLVTALRATSERVT